MAQGRTEERRTSNRGFASMDQERQRQIASMGGKAVPDSKRSFSQNRELAAAAGRKGGQSVPGEKRSFSQNRELAAAAGRKGGQSVPDEKVNELIKFCDLKRLLVIPLLLLLLVVVKWGQVGTPGMT